MTYHAYSTHRKGFTLIELLVVVAIIAVLASLGFGAFRMAQDKAKETTAKKALSDLIMASDGFYDSYNYLPLSSGETTDTLRKSDNDLMSVLVGLDSATDENPNKEKFFSGNRAKGRGTNAFNGLYQTNSEAFLYGPWKLSQEDEKFYRIVYDYDFDEEIRETENVGSDIIRGFRQIAYCLGKDGEAGPNKNEDNVYSYK